MASYNIPPRIIPRTSTARIHYTLAEFGGVVLSPLEEWIGEITLPSIRSKSQVSLSDITLQMDVDVPVAASQSKASVTEIFVYAPYEVIEPPFAKSESRLTITSVVLSDNYTLNLPSIKSESIFSLQTMSTKYPNHVCFIAPIDRNTVLGIDDSNIDKILDTL